MKSCFNFLFFTLHSSLTRYITRFCVRDKVWAGGFDAYRAPAARRPVCVRRAVGDCVEGAEVCCDLSVEPAHVFQSPNLAQASASAVREHLHAYMRGVINGCLRRIKEGQAFGIAGRQRERVDSHALTISRA